ncbi:DUF2332 family protein [Parasphingopyxis algicola]|uniref:DUF2332 domain-containing protein n=1 Tax=Parasphingopyxis algicola TaxID=2026624 RepID=UPI0015A26171|nr:DUF2332 family protein [Parasphingopyxis algicola]QLC25333.1 DUF2332 family protein [Parasphingopyxis algicola]
MSKRESEIRDAFREQAGFCRALGSRLTADVLDAVAENLRADTKTGGRVLAWRGDPAPTADALALRLAGGLHALARSGKDEALSDAYRGTGDVAGAVAEALLVHDDWLESWFDSPPQTNEPGRAAAVMAALLVAAQRYPLPVELFEIGSSAGLVLNLGHYRYDLGGTKAGDPASPLLLEPEWRGPAPPAADIEIVSRRGVDLRPIDLCEAAAGERLAAYCWADQKRRVDNADRAIALARRHPPPIDAGDAADWVARTLAEPREDGRLRIFFHTITLQYLPDDAQNRVRAAVAEAGARASETRPFGWISFELPKSGKPVELRLRLWPSGDDLLLANAHPHASWIEWFDG